MVIGTADKDRVRTLLREAIPMMCRSGLQFKSEFAIEALVGITLDKDVFLVSIKETFKSDDDLGDVEAAVASADYSNQSATVDDTSVGVASPNRTKRKRRRSRDSASAKRRASAASSDSEGERESPSPTTFEQQPVLSLEDASLDNAFDVTAEEEQAEDTQTSDSATTKHQHGGIKQENDEDDSDELIVIKDEPGQFHNNRSDCVESSQLYQSAGSSVGASSGVLPAASAFAMSQFPQSSNMCSTDMQPGPSSGLDVSGQLLQSHDPQQVGTFYLHFF